jgi:hypothetical protein
MEHDLHDGLPPILNVDNLANGAVYELLQRELTRMADNILDPNTSEKQKRKIKIEIIAQPYPDRSGAVYTVGVNSTLAGIKPAEGNLYIVRRGGETIVVSRNHKQMELEMQPVSSETAEIRKPS